MEGMHLSIHKYFDFYISNFQKCKFENSKIDFQSEFQFVFIDINYINFEKFSKIENSKIEFQFVPIDINDINLRIYQNCKFENSKIDF